MKKSLIALSLSLVVSSTVNADVCPSLDKVRNALKTLGYDTVLGLGGDVTVISAANGTICNYTKSKAVLFSLEKKSVNHQRP